MRLLKITLKVDGMMCGMCKSQGYRVLVVNRENYEKKGLFGFRK